VSLKNEQVKQAPSFLSMCLLSVALFPSFVLQRAEVLPKFKGLIPVHATST
jgi:hypothetical protein